MKRSPGLLLALTAIALVLLALPAAASAATPLTTTCSGGEIAPGTYRNLRVTGVCSIPNGPVKVSGNIAVLPGAALNAISGAALEVSGNITVGWGAILGLGCSPDVGCPFLSNNQQVDGNIVAVQPLAVIVHGLDLGGNFIIQGGTGSLDCGSSTDLLEEFAGEPIPAYSVLEDSEVDGSVVINGYRGCWLGVIRVDAGGMMAVTNNHLGDPDANEVVTNEVGGSLVCLGNSPEAQVGDSGGDENQVEGQKIGECSGL